MSIIQTVKVDLFCNKCGWQEIVKGDDDTVFAKAEEEIRWHGIACPKREG